MGSDRHERLVLLKDRLARYLITAGGVTVILSVAAIMLFIFVEMAPLLYSPEAKLSSQWAAGQRLSPVAGMAVGADEYRETAFRLNETGAVDFLSLKTGEALKSIPNPALNGKRITAASRAVKRNWIAFGTADGMAGASEVRYAADFSGAARTVTHSVRNGEQLYQIDPARRPVRIVAGAPGDDGGISIAAVKDDGGVALLTAGESGESRIAAADVGGARITALAMKSTGRQLIAGAADGMVYVFDIENGQLHDAENFKASSAGITALRFLNGDETLAVGDEKGEVAGWLAVRHVIARNNGAKKVTLDRAHGIVLKPGEEREVIDRNYAGQRGASPDIGFAPAGMRYLRVRGFAPHASAVTAIAPSPRNKGFVTSAADGLTYHYATTGKSYPVAPQQNGTPLVAFTPKSDGIIVLARDGVLYDYALNARHPDVTFGTLFGKVWYEGYPEPAHVWQSTGGSDDFEPKFSLWPLMFGTLKGTLYAMLFSVPVALLGALYLSQLAPARLRNIVKPVIELMAAIPSVVVGFLAGLWLSPLLDRHLMAFFMVLFSLPAAWFVFVAVMWAIPWDKRPDISGRYELLYLLPVLAAGLVLGAALAPAAEAGIFGGDVKNWLYQSFALTYDPRNCVVVGFALGFAVIPIIFTIAEDALTAVPPSLTSASFALAASRWQTAIHVVLPAASPGIFAAIMLGLGRAVGETMIVLMATGNTPIMDWSIFNGMRAMSATIAVEMPEAPVGGSLYRILFLVGFILFAFTFAINTLAGLISNRLRRKYSRF